MEYIKHIVIMLSLFLFLTGCSQINENDAIEIALEEAHDFKPENNKFEIYSVEDSSRGWGVIICSEDPNFDEPSPNILVEVSKYGKVIKRTNFAFAE